MRWVSLGLGGCREKVTLSFSYLDMAGLEKQTDRDVGDLLQQAAILEDSSFHCK